MAVPLPPRTSSADGFYSTNNPFQLGGPKGFSEFTTLETNHTVLFARTDFPGVPEEGMKTLLDKSKKFVLILANAPKVHDHDSSHRKYGTSISLELICKCCLISSYTSHVCDGVLRLLITKTGSDPYQRACKALPRINPEELRFKGSAKFHGTDPHDPKLTGPVLEPHPKVLEGSNLPYESKQLADGKLLVRVDMPGVPKDKFIVSVTNGRVNVTGLAPAVSHDSSGRFYHGVVAMLPTDVNIPASRIKTIAKNGVIRLLIPSV